MTRGSGQSVRPLHARDTDATAFTAILTDLISRIPGAHSAALVDSLGEAVDYTGRVAPFDVKVAGAHYKIIVDELRSRPSFRGLRTLFVRGSRGSFAVRAIPDDYAIVVMLSKRAGFATTRALDVCERALIEEAGLSPRALTSWTVVAVDCDKRRRPVRVTTLDRATSARAEVLGAVRGLPNRERGYRVRLETGAELMLVRELGGTWYAEESIDHSASSS